MLYLAFSSFAFLKIILPIKGLNLGGDFGSNHELLVAKFRLKLKRVGNTTRPFRYDLSQIPYNYTVKVRNRFKGLDLRLSA